MGLISLLLLGLVAGAIARAVLPGRQNGGWLSTLVVGIVGSFVGGLLGNVIFHSGLRGFFNPWTWLLAILGSILVLFVYGKLQSRRS